METYTNGTSLLRPLETSSRSSNKMSWKRVTKTSWGRSTETSLGVSFEMYLRRCWDVQRVAVTTFAAGWELKNAPKWKDGKKNANDANDRINTIIF